MRGRGTIGIGEESQRRLEGVASAGRRQQEQEREKRKRHGGCIDVDVMGLDVVFELFD